MGILVAIGRWILGHSWQQIAWACAVLAIGLFCSYEIVHQRNIGYDECRADDAKANAAAQERADAVIASANAKLHTDLDELNQPLPGYLQVYGDKSKAADCAPVPYKRVMKP